MEAVGLVASLINIVQGIDTACKIALENVHASEGVKKEYGLLIGKLSTYKGLIEGIRLQAELDASSQGRIATLNHIAGPLQACKFAVILIQERLKKLPKHVVFGKVIDKDVARCLKTFDESMPILQLALHADQRVMTAAVQEYVERMSEEVTATKDLAETTLAQVADLKRLALGDEERRLEEVKLADRDVWRRWLTQNDSSSAQPSEQARSLPDSGAWFVLDLLPQWLNVSAEKRPVLWLHGQSGAGKTTLVSLAVQHIERQPVLRTPQCLATFFCNFSNGKLQTPIEMLGSYLVQICSQLPQLWDLVKEAYVSMNKRPLQESDVSVLINLISTACNVSASILLILDGPNETDYSSDMIEILTDLAERNATLRVLISSTEDVKIDPFTDRNIYPVSMDRDSVRSDLREYLVWHIHNERRLRRLDSGLRESIVRTLVKEAGNCFRWACCQVVALAENARSQDAVEKCLTTLSKTLGELYIETLAMVKDMDRPLVQSALMWLAFSPRPMKLGELCEALILQEGMTTINPTTRLFPDVVEDVLRKCRMLVDYNVSAELVKLAHSSVHQFLSSQSCKNSVAAYFYLDERESLTKLTKLSLGYLNLDEFRSGYCSTPEDLSRRSKMYPLMKYVSRYWTGYYERLASLARHPTSGQQAKGSMDTTIIEGLRSPLKQLLDSANDNSYPRNGNFGSWVQAIVPAHATGDVNLSRPLYYAARHGLYNLAVLILELYGSPQLEELGGSHASTPLHVAIFYRQREIVSLLLSKGANPNETNGSGERGIVWAYLNKDDDILQMLLNHGARAMTAEDLRAGCFARNLPSAITDRPEWSGLTVKS